MKNTKNIIILALLIVILAMSVGYSTFVTQISLSGTAEIIGEWNVKVTSVAAEQVSEGCDCGEPQYTNTTVSFDAKLLKPGDSITYVITIQNAGTIDAVLSNVIYKEIEGGSPAISYTTSELKSELAAGETTTYNVTIEYNKDTTEVPSVKTKSITGIVEYAQK